MKNILEYSAAFFLILNLNSIYAAIPFFPLNHIFIILSASIILILSLKNKCKNNQLKRISLFLFFYYLAAIPIFIQAENIKSFFANFLVSLPIFIVYFSTKSQECDRYSILKAFANLMLIEGLISLLFYVLGTSFQLIQPTGEILIDWGEIKSIPYYWGIYFEGQTYRNSGIFTEAPMHSFCLSLAFLFETFFFNNLSKKKAFIWVICILSTRTTTGILVLIGSLCLKTFSTKRNKSPFIKFCLIIFSMTILIVCYIFLKELLLEKAETHSYNIRLYMILKDISTWINAPIFGSGFGTNGDGNSNSLFLILADGGLYLFLLYVMPLFVLPIMMSYKSSNRNRLFFFLVFCGMFCITIVAYKLLILLLIALSISALIRIPIKQPNKKKE